MKFKLRYTLQEGLAQFHNEKSYQKYFKMIRDGPLFFLGENICDFQKNSCTAKTAEKKCKGAVVKKNRSIAFYYPGHVFDLEKNSNKKLLHTKNMSCTT